MTQIKIISNPYFGYNEEYYSISYQFRSDVSDSWKDIDADTNQNSSLYGIKYSSGYFSDKMREILDEIDREYGRVGEKIELIFEGIGYEYRMLESLCGGEYSDRFTLSRSDKTLSETDIVKTELDKSADSISENLNKILVNTVSCDVLNKMGYLNKLKAAFDSLLTIKKRYNKPGQDSKEAIRNLECYTDELLTELLNSSTMLEDTINNLDSRTNNYSKKVKTYRNQAQADINRKIKTAKNDFSDRFPIIEGVPGYGYPFRPGYYSDFFNFEKKKLRNGVYNFKFAKLNNLKDEINEKYKEKKISLGKKGELNEVADQEKKLNAELEHDANIAVLSYMNGKLYDVLVQFRTDLINCFKNTFESGNEKFLSKFEDTLSQSDYKKLPEEPIKTNVFLTLAEAEYIEPSVFISDETVHNDLYRKVTQAMYSHAKSLFDTKIDSIAKDVKILLLANIEKSNINILENELLLKNHSDVKENLLASAEIISKSITNISRQVDFN